MTTKDGNPKDLAATSKIPLWLCSPIAMAKWAVAQLSGLLKYGAWNWRDSGVRVSVYASAAKRHIDAYMSGEAVDPIDGTDHRANAMACMAILIDAEAAGNLVDDRPPSVDLRPTYAEQEALAAKLIKQYEDRNPRHFTIADTKRAPVSSTSFAVGDRVRVTSTNGVFEGVIDRHDPKDPDLSWYVIGPRCEWCASDELTKLPAE